MTRHVACVLALVVLLASCDDMTDQDKAKPYSRAAGSVHEARETVPTQEATSVAPPLSLALLERGQQRYRIYCTPCHSELGDGNGMVVQRGFPHPPSYHSERLRQASTQHFYDVITQGYGVMYSFAGRVAPGDRWAIAAYIRALQLSQHASAPDLPSAQP